jgi:two-component system, chemotaxis family, chemotaxis protein CheY
MSPWNAEHDSHSSQIAGFPPYICLTTYEKERIMSQRVLIVDDSMLMRHMVGEVLASDGWEVVGEAANGQQAAELYRALQPDAATLDIIMPKSDGLVALKAILKIDPNAKVVVLSALNQTKLISEAIRHGAYDFIAKPFMPEQLQRTMRAILDDAVAV